MRGHFHAHCQFNAPALFMLIGNVPPSFQKGVPPSPTWRFLGCPKCKALIQSHSLTACNADYISWGHTHTVHAEQKCSVVWLWPQKYDPPSAANSPFTYFPTSPDFPYGPNWFCSLSAPSLTFLTTALHLGDMKDNCRTLTLSINYGFPFSAALWSFRQFHDNW